jgi:hypothetical protein
MYREAGFVFLLSGIRKTGTTARVREARVIPQSQRPALESVRSPKLQEIAFGGVLASKFIAAKSCVFSEGCL